MKYNYNFLFLFLSLFFINPSLIFASTTNGTIDSVYHYAWGENIGFVDFSQVTIADSSLSGSVYSENTGWIDLSTITNNSEGTLGGYAWGENIGWVDFSHVTIGTNGVFAGGAYGENIGWMIFDTGNSEVMTDWRPASTRGGGGSSGSRRSSPTLALSPTTPVAPSVCGQGDRFSSATGLPCYSPSSPSTTPLPQCYITATLRQGSRGQQVKCLQTILYITSDGIFGPKTKASVVLFQIQNKLIPDGIVGPITRAKLLIK